MSSVAPARTVIERTAPRRKGAGAVGSRVGRSKCCSSVSRCGGHWGSVPSSSSSPRSLWPLTCIAADDFAYLPPSASGCCSCYGLRPGSFVLWAHAPGTVDGGGPARLVGFRFWGLWYLAITVAMLYPLSFSSRVLPGMTVVRWLAIAFLFVAGGGLLGVLLPSLQFPSPMEFILPGARGPGFLHTLVHPSLTIQSDFLGYEQPRPKAPFAYPNAWGNNFGLLLPFFVLGWGTSERRWQRFAVPFVLILAIIPVAFSLNRGLWIGLTILMVYAAVNTARSGHFAGLLALVAVVALGAGVVLGDAACRHDSTARGDPA